MKIFYSDTFELPLPDKHRFPMSKYRLLRERIAASELFRDVPLAIPTGATNLELQRVHDCGYVQKVIDGRLSPLEQKRIGFPWSRQLVERSRRSVGASMEAAAAAMRNRVSVNLAGGTHHAFHDAGQGYCVFNDVVVAAKMLQVEFGLTRILVIDLDVHQGNGTAALTQQDPNLFSFSMHCEKNFPFRKTEGDLDVGLEPGAGDDEYLQHLERSLDCIDQQFRPEFVFYLAGADPFEGDRLGQLSLTKKGLKQRDQMVFQFCQLRQLPVAMAMAGGYANDVNDIVDIHFASVVTALEFCQAQSQ